MTQYQTVIGLEVHIQLSTASKMFCSDSTQFGAAPNTQVSAISLAHPGTLPRPNRSAVESAVRLGLALDSQINLVSFFDRKNYFYADLPKGYQITQDQRPVCVGGHLDIGTEGGAIHHIHMEEDAGKSIHDQDPRDSLIDLNRAGVPLLELVTMPTLHSAEEASRFMEQIRRLVRWLGISDGNMEEGSLRCDVNISVRPVGTEKLGQRCEIKNVNSMRFARRAIEYEVSRQIEVIEGGGTISQETRGFDPATGTTYSLREKEYAHDYRYFPDPDLPPIVVTPERLEQIKADMPLLPHTLEARFVEYGIPASEARLLTAERDTAFFTLKLSDGASTPSVHAKAAANLVINTLLPWCTEQNKSITECEVPIESWLTVFDMIGQSTIGASAAKQKLYPALLQQPDADPKQLAEALGLLQSSNQDQVSVWADELLTRFPDKVAEYRKGKKGLIGFFMGELMKTAKGQLDPKAATKILEEKLQP
jgi:aspartyl-tRNA(Asn)/glutamyl-tRNA(Gln) amidotransferase subunit B